MGEKQPRAITGTQLDFEMFERIKRTGAHGMHTSMYAEVVPVLEHSGQLVLPGIAGGETTDSFIVSAEDLDGGRGSYKLEDHVL